MANGKKNYFRHSFFARNDIKLLQLRDRIGVGFYFYFFTLLELCGEQSADELQPFYEFHDSTIRNLWCVNLKKSERIANEMHAVCLLKFEKREKSFRFEIPNLAKYLGKYTTKNESKPVSKGKERKEKESKGKERKEKFNAHDVIKIYNELCPVKHRGFDMTPLALEDFLVTTGFKPFDTLDGWREIFTKVRDSEFCNSDNWCNLSWLVKADNAMKVLNGAYDNKASDVSYTPRDLTDEEVDF